MLSVLSADRPTLQEVIRLVRRRWRLRMALRGAAIVAAATLGVVVLATWGMDQLRFSDMAVNGLRWCSYAGLAGVTWW